MTFYLPRGGEAGSQTARAQSEYLEIGRSVVSILGLSIFPLGGREGDVTK